MSFTISQASRLTLTICIATFNRANFIGETLDSILLQAPNECDVVVLDGGSSDNTEQVLSRYARNFSKLRYFRQDKNNGIDSDYDRAVELAIGEYCWLMTDDDLLKTGAVKAVLEELRRDLSLIIVNTEIKSFDMSKVLEPRLLQFDENRRYAPGEMDRLFEEVGDVLKYIGGIIIKRSIWLGRDRARHLGSLFNYVGIIFQEPLPGEAVIIAEPLISYRLGNMHTFSARQFETLWHSWPSLVHSLAISDSVKSRVCRKEIWKQLRPLLLSRAQGAYSLHEYRRWLRPRLQSVPEAGISVAIAVLPGTLINTLLVFYYSVTHSRYQGVWQSELMLQILRDSRYYFRNWRVFLLISRALHHLGPRRNMEDSSG